MKRSVSLLACFSLLLFSCTTTSVLLTTQQKKLNRAAEANVDKAVVLNKPMVADLDVRMNRDTVIYKTNSGDISNTSILTTLPASTGQGAPILVSASESMKDEAVNRAQFYFLEQKKCDYIVDPIYKVETESKTGSSVVDLTITVSGYPANYRQFTQPDSLPKSIFQLRQLDSREIPLLTNALKTDVKTTKPEAGFLIAPALGKTLDYYDNLGTIESGFNLSAGIYHVSKGDNRVRFRYEILASYRTFSSTSTVAGIETTVDNKFVTVDLPLMLDIKLIDNLCLSGGVSLSRDLVANYSISQQSSGSSIDGTYEVDEIVSPSGIFGLRYGFGSGVNLGLRITTGKWKSVGIGIGLPF